MGDDILKRLYNVLEERKTADPDTSYVASLYQKGTGKIAQKVGEEAVETIIEALQNNRDRLKEESADLLFHLMVLWADAGLKPEEILSILEKRFGTSGLDEKAARTEIK
ncbi:MAG: phosphoribosyl-ATP diphosphatase [Rhodospirillales bacterium]|nr:phosphoribosyl-ATP diphosphatase [Alphaproteobacteria bacterium]USO04086.1 MAG: phosphoribosyl-ATP diphosphatase [Rhodospirillales bacterium]